MNFKVDLPKDKSSIIKVIGVGGGGGNAVNYMYEQGISGVAARHALGCNTRWGLTPTPLPHVVGAVTGALAGVPFPPEIFPSVQGGGGYPPP